jgi:hypothetical protein
MTAQNGRTNGSAIDNRSEQVLQTITPPAPMRPSTGPQFSIDEIKHFIAELEVPFDPAVIEWRVTNTTKSGKLRGQVIPYADPRAYTDRLNSLFTPAGWTRKYGVHTSANFVRGQDQKTVAKVFVTCELTIFGLGSHSATGEEWTDNDNAGTSAEAQAFKRSCACFGLGRYLYDFAGIWVDLDERKRPKSAMKLFDWATPEGWRQGFRPERVSAAPTRSSSSSGNPDGRERQQNAEADVAELVRQIEALERPLGKGLYRGLLKTVARVWRPSQVQDMTLLQKLLAHMLAAERGLLRLEAAVGLTGPEALARILESLKLDSMERVDNLETLKEVVLKLEGVAAEGKRNLGHYRITRN